MEGWLAGGDLRSDGASNQVADLVLSQPDLVLDLLDACQSSDPVVRGRAADALEKVGRTRPNRIVPFSGTLIETLLADDVPMVRWHVAMLLGHLTTEATLRPRIRQALLGLLDDRSVLVASWAITSLCLVAYLDPSTTDEIVQAIGPLQHADSPALRTRAQTALSALTKPGGMIPPEWIKSERVRNQISLPERHRPA
jgi:HEAT repeat protein